MHKLAFIILLSVCIANNSTAQFSLDQVNDQSSSISSNYAYVRIEGKFLSKKLKVKVDLGDSDIQVAKGEELSTILTNKKSYAAVLNYMSELGYELVSTLDLTKTYDGSGGTTGVVYLMKKPD